MESEEYYRPIEASKILNVTTRTLTNWEKSGKLSSIKTPGGQNRYLRSDIISFRDGLKTQNNQGKTGQSSSSKVSETARKRRYVCYCRVSSYSQKSDLERQIKFFRLNYPTHEIIRDIGSGLNSKRKGFLSLLDASIEGDIQEIVVTHKDRLCRFDFELFERIVTRYSHGKIVVLDKTETSPEEELTKDLLSIITVFSARLHGLRSHKITRELKNSNLPNETRDRRNSSA